MDGTIRHMIERFPDKAAIIRSLGESNARFKDLIGDHHAVSEELSGIEKGDRATDRAKVDELQSRRANLEEELVLLMENHQRI
jgi:uncharacterized protein YdcH (DUF465 family)